MITYLKGRLVEKSPVHAIVECNGLGYFVHITLNTFSNLPNDEQCKIFVHEVIREDAYTLFGFTDEEEREIFRKLISVSGVGASTGRVILSSLSTEEVRQIIFSGDVDAMKRIKGIGAKTAQRIIVDLQDKIYKDDQEIEKIQLADNALNASFFMVLSAN